MYYLCKFNKNGGRERPFHPQWQITMVAKKN